MTNCTLLSELFIFKDTEPSPLPSSPNMGYTVPMSVTFSNGILFVRILLPMSYLHKPTAGKWLIKVISLYGTFIPYTDNFMLTMFAASKAQIHIINPIVHCPLTRASLDA